MYICTACGNTFTEPREIRTYLGDMGSRPVFETESVSPCCLEPYEEAATCEKCGEHISKEQYDRSGLCKECEAAAEIRFNAMLREVFTEREIEYLNIVYDGEYFGLKKGEQK